MIGYIKCKLGYHELMQVPKKDYLSGRWGCHRCSRCDEEFEGMKIPPMPKCKPPKPMTESRGSYVPSPTQVLPPKRK